MFRPFFNRMVGLHRAFRPNFVARNFWGWRRYPCDGLERYVDRRLWEVDRELNRVFQDLEQSFSPARFPRWQPPFFGWRCGREVPVEVAEDGSRKMIVKVDVSHFRPEEVRVTLSDGLLIVRAKHEEVSQAGGKVCREYVKEFTLPEDVDQETVRSLLGDDGVLRIEGLLPAIKASAEKEIPIQKTPAEKPGNEQQNKN